MGQLREFAEELRMRFMKNRDPRKQQYILRNTKNLSKPPLKNWLKQLKVKQKSKVITQKITKMQNTAKKAVEEHLGAITHAINNIAKHPQNVINEMEKITSSISHMCMALTVVSGRDYKDLVSKVKSPGNEENIEITNNYISKMNDHRDSAFEAVNAIKKKSLRVE
ncbi:hypothetical protein BASA60_011322 [Batrachochytrium salamandrivorans]|nr:hypothetical protein BASA60_011322 [Batrachochytrium salamandrivorans]